MQGPKQRQRERPNPSGARVYNRRLELGWTQAQLGERVGVRKLAVTHYEGGVRVPPANVVFALRRELALPDLYEVQPCPCGNGHGDPCADLMVDGRLPKGHGKHPAVSKRIKAGHAEKRSRAEARKAETGLIDLHDVAKILKTHESKDGPAMWTRRRGIAPVEVVDVGVGKPLHLFERKVIEAEIKKWANELPNHFDGNASRAAKWYRNKTNSTVMDARLNVQLAAEKGQTVGRRVPQAEAELLKRQAEHLRSLNPDLTADQIVETLMLKHRGAGSVKREDGTRRLKRDLAYRKARAWVERRLQAYT